MYLMIRNLGVADYRGFTLLGVSTTRNAGHDGTIGQFGSGSKHAIALLLRNGIEPLIVCGNLKMTFFVKEHTIKQQQFQQVCVRYSGKDTDGKTINRTEDLGFTLSWGESDWTKHTMAFREFVSNAIDGAIVAGGNYTNVEFEVVSEPRAKAGFTSVFLPYTDEIKKCHENISMMFLHYKNPLLLFCKVLPKQDETSSTTLVYKNGVLVCYMKEKSVCDYNLGSELTLDESRNASEWDVRYAIAQSLRNESENNLTTVLKGVLESPDSLEGKLDGVYLKNNQYNTPEEQDKRKKVFRNAWNRAAGEKAVAVSGNVGVSSFVEAKGFTPRVLPAGWVSALESHDCPTESSVLSRNELEGKEVFDPTPVMLDCVAKVWLLFEKYKLTNSKPAPAVKGFASILNGGSQTLGYYIPGETCIYLLATLGAGKMLFKVALEEIVHYTTGSDDNSRDIQDFLFNLVTEITF